MRVLRLLMIPVVAILALTGCSGSTAEPVTIDLTVPDGGLGETIRQEVPVGAPVTMNITTAFDDEVHLHGYELTIKTTAGAPGTLSFNAVMAGTYEVESHVTDEIYMQLVVR